MATALTRKDFVSDQEVRWCPGCGDYAILAQVQKIMPELGVARENTVFISGIGCSSRFPYYMNTYGFHTIHGRAPAVATGLKVTRPELDVWVVTGDGDGLSIGGNHLIHVLRRNVDLKILLFNNQIYGLTKGQYSPTSEVGKVTKSTPAGSVDFPFNPITVALGAHATFVARTIDVEQKHLGEMLKRGHAHRGASFVEILQNCNIFNDDAFNDVSDKTIKADHQLVLREWQAAHLRQEPRQRHPHERDASRGGAARQWREREAIIVVHDESNLALAFMLGNFEPPMPTPIGVFYCVAASDLRRRDEQAARRGARQDGRRRSAKAAAPGRYLDGQLANNPCFDSKGPEDEPSGSFSIWRLSQSASAAPRKLDSRPSGRAQVALLITLFELAFDHALFGFRDRAGAGEHVAGDGDSAVLPSKPDHARARPGPVGDRLVEEAPVQMGLHQDVRVAFGGRVGFVEVNSMRVPGHRTEAEELNGGRPLDQRRERDAGLYVLEAKLMTMHGRALSGQRAMKVSRQVTSGRSAASR